MELKHVSDHDIQQFVFDISECNTEIIAHISSCSTCKMRAESYQSLSVVIKNQPDPVFEFSLSEQVLEQLEITPKKEATHGYFIYGLIALSVGIIISSLYYFKDIFSNLLSTTTTTTYFFISIVLLISLVLGIDMVRSFNKKIKMLNY